MVDIEAQPTVESLMALSDAIRLIQEETGRGLTDAVGFAAVKVAESGRAASKIGKKNRASITNPEYSQARGSFAWARAQMRQGKEIPESARAALNDLNSITPFLIVRQRQGGKLPLMMPSWEKKDLRRLIERRGIAKKTWSVMGAKMAATKGQDRISVTGGGYRVSKYTEKYGEGKGAFVARLVNKLSYLEDAYPGITQTAISKGTAALVGQVERKIASAARRANK